MDTNERIERILKDLPLMTTEEKVIVRLQLEALVIQAQLEQVQKMI